jgi:hypothetical protein
MVIAYALELCFFVQEAIEVIVFLPVGLRIAFIGTPIGNSARPAAPASSPTDG